MTRAYNEMYLNNARRSLANSFDYAVYTLGLELNDYYKMFIRSDLCTRFEKGDPFIVSGKSGVELALMIVARNTGDGEYRERIYHDGKSPEYWVGWALAYYQWYTSCRFLHLEDEISITSVMNMYYKYHEMDIMHFVDRLNEMRQAARLTTYLKKYRELRGYSQSELSQITGIPLKTLQHYEQGDKPLARANAIYLISLARALNCNPEALMI